MKIEIKKTNGEIIEIDSPNMISTDQLKELMNPLLNKPKKAFDFQCWPAKFTLQHEN